MIDTTHGTKVPDLILTQGMRMTAARKMAGLTQQQLADLFGNHVRTIIRWEQDEIRVPYIALVALSVATDVNLGWLQTGVKDMPSAEHLELIAMDEQDAVLAGNVRPEGFEPPTFWFGADSYTLAA